MLLSRDTRASPNTNTCYGIFSCAVRPDLAISFGVQKEKRHEEREMDVVSDTRDGFDSPAICAI